MPELLEIAEIPPEMEVLEEESPFSAALTSIFDKKEDDTNLLKGMKKKEVQDIKNRVMEGYNMDKDSMKDYLSRHKKIIELASMKAPAKDKTFPFQGASQVMMPYLAQAAIDFNSRTVPEVVNNKHIAKVAVWGIPNHEKSERAKRIASAINYQLKVGIVGWGKREDRALLDIPITGQYFKKKWWENGSIKEALITTDRMIYDHESSSFEDAPRKSHQFEIEYNDYRSNVTAKEWEEIEYFSKKNVKDRQQKETEKEIEPPLALIESLCDLDLDDDGYGEPYLVTWSEEYDTLLRIEPMFTPDDVELLIKDGEPTKQVRKIFGEKLFTQTGFIPSLEKPAVYDGWGTLLYDTFDALNTFYRQLLDAGTLNNIAGSSGFINSNVRVGGRARKGNVEMIQGQLTPIDVGHGQNLTQAIFTMPFQGPSQGLYDLLQNLKEEVLKYTSASQSIDVNPGDAATLYLSRLQQALKVPNAIMSRVYRGLGEEFNRVYDLLRRYMSEEEYFAIIDWEPEVDESQIPPEAQQQFQQASAMAQQAGQPPPPPPQQIQLEQQIASVSKEQDFAADPDIIPTADPTMGGEAERVARAAAIKEASVENPLYNQYEVEKNFLESMNTAQIDLILPKPSNEPSPADQAQQEFLAMEREKLELKREEINTQKTRVQKELIDLKLKAEKQDAEVDKLISETMKNLADIDMSDAQRSEVILASARADNESEQQQAAANTSV